MTYTLELQMRHRPSPALTSNNSGKNITFLILIMFNVVNINDIIVKNTEHETLNIKYREYNKLEDCWSFLVDS